MHLCAGFGTNLHMCFCSIGVLLVSRLCFQIVFLARNLMQFDYPAGIPS